MIDLVVIQVCIYTQVFFFLLQLFNFTYPLHQGTILFKIFSKGPFDAYSDESTYHDSWNKYHDEIHQRNVCIGRKLRHFRKYIAYNQKHNKSAIIKFKEMVVHIDYRMIRFPYSYDWKIEHTQTSD